MKSGWTKKTLDQISINLDHKRVPITKAVRAGGQYPYYGASGIVDYVADYIFEGDALLVSEDGANLLARSTPIAFPASGRYWVNNHAHILKFDNITTQQYVEFYLESIPLDQYITGAAQPKLNQKALNSIPIPIAPFAEQQQIVRILNDAFERIEIAKANSEINLENASALLESHHHFVFSRARHASIDVRLGDIANFRNGINYTKQSKGRSIRILGVKDFQNHFWAPTENLDIVKLDGELGEMDTVTEGDILSVRSNGNPNLIGRCMLVGSLSEPVTHSGFTIRIRLQQEKALPQYICHFLKSRKVRRQLVEGGNGVNIKSLNQGMLADTIVPLPPIEMQYDVISEIESLSNNAAKLSDLQTRKLSALTELRKSLLHHAFTGELTATKVVEEMEAVA